MNEKRLPVTGGCLCGAIRYQSTEPPVNGGCCHCSLCRKATGGLFFPWVAFPDGTFEISKGEPSYFQSTHFAKRGFCPDCGTPLTFRFEGNPIPGVSVGSLDRPDDWPLTQEGWWGHGFVGDKVSWYAISDGLPQHSAPMPERDAAEALAASQRKSSS